VKEVTGGGGWRLVVKKITQREATRKVAKRKGKEHTSAGYDMGPWETEREALAASTTFRNWVEFGQARHPGPPQNANRKRSHGAAAAAADCSERKERLSVRAKKLKELTKLDDNMERQRGYALKREEWIQQLHEAITLDAVHTLIRPRSQKDEDPIDLTVELADIDLSKVQKNRVLAIAQALKFYYTLLNEKFAKAALAGEAYSTYHCEVCADTAAKPFDGCGGSRTLREVYHVDFSRHASLGADKRGSYVRPWLLDEEDLLQRFKVQMRSMVRFHIHPHASTGVC